MSLLAKLAKATFYCLFRWQFETTLVHARNHLRVGVPCLPNHHVDFFFHFIVEGLTEVVDKSLCTAVSEQSWEWHVSESTACHDNRTALLSVKLLFNESLR